MTGNDGALNAINIFASSRATPKQETLVFYAFSKNQGES